MRRSAFGPERVCSCGKILPLAERLEPDAGEEALAGVGPALDLERLMVDVERGLVVLAEDALPQPVLEEPGGAGVAVVLGVVARLLLFSSRRMTLYGLPS